MQTNTAADDTAEWRAPRTGGDQVKRAIDDCWDEHFA